MPCKLVWTTERDRALAQARASGGTWDVVAAGLHISRNAAIERSRRIGALLPPRIVPTAVKPDPDRAPLYPGHPESWGAIVNGTILADLPYPIPPPMGAGRS